MKLSVLTSKDRTYLSTAVPLPDVQIDVPMLRLSDFVAWQNTVIASKPNVYRVRKWGDKILVDEAGRSIPLTSVNTNFQAVGIFNKSNNTLGGVSNYLRIPISDYARLKDMQPNDDYIQKQADYKQQKLNYLSNPTGTIYFWNHINPGADDWEDLSVIEWGTIVLGGNLVTVDGLETFSVKTPDNVRRTRVMARLRGFRRSDWERPLTDLLAEGLVHRAFGVYGDNNSFGDSPKGIVYTPFWSPRDWIFIGSGQTQPTEFYIPLDWLSK